MKIEKVILFLKKTTSFITNRILSLYNKVKNSKILRIIKESKRKVLLASKEKTYQLYQKVRNSSFYRKHKDFYLLLLQRTKSLLSTTKQFLVKVYNHARDSQLIRNVASITKSSIIPFFKETVSKLKNFFEKIVSFTKLTIVPFYKEAGIKLKNSFNNVIRFTRENIITKPLIFVPVLTVINILLIIFILQQTIFARYYWEGEEEKKFTVTLGQTLNEVVDELSKQNIIQNPFVFRFLAKITGKEGDIIARHYIFKNGMSNLELLELLTNINISQTVRFTVIEGLTIKEIGKVVEARFFLSSQKFIKETKNDSLLNILGLKDSVNNLEGFLFPDTYIVPLNINEKYLVENMFDEFLKRVFNNDEIKSRISEENTSILKVITLASIVQAETPLEKEKHIVSGVYHNRLQKRMRLEADPTVQYILPNGPKKRLLYSDLKIESPYNTYLNFGLPPGPINNPGFSAIEAALNPEQHEYLFFVANGKGGHKFSETYSEHLRAVQEYRYNRRKQNNNN